jgi:hypothetical protein
MERYADHSFETALVLGGRVTGTARARDVELDGSVLEVGIRENRHQFLILSVFVSGEWGEFESVTPTIFHPLRAGIDQLKPGGIIKGGGGIRDFRSLAERNYKRQDKKYADRELR